MTPFIGNESTIALVESTQTVHSDTFNRPVVEFDRIAAFDGRCTQYFRFGLYLVCPQGKLINQKEFQIENDMLLVSDHFYTSKRNKT